MPIVAPPVVALMVGQGISRFTSMAPTEMPMSMTFQALLNLRLSERSRRQRGKKVKKRKKKRPLGSCQEVRRSPRRAPLGCRMSASGVF